MNSPHKGQLALPMLTYYEAPVVVHPDVLVGVKTYREAVRLCWQLRKRVNLSKAILAEEAGLYASHVSDYLSQEDGKRELPAKYVASFESACGNRAVSQWLAGQADLTILEEVQQMRRAA